MVAVNVAAGVISITKTGGSEMNIPADAIVSITVHNKPVRIASLASATGYDNSDLWFVRIKLKDNTFEDIVMGTVTNQASCVNTQAGANIAEGVLDNVFA